MVQGGATQRLAAMAPSFHETREGCRGDGAGVVSAIGPTDATDVAFMITRVRAQATSEHNGTGGESIYGGKFEDEAFHFKRQGGAPEHGERGPEHGGASSSSPAGRRRTSIASTSSSGSEERHGGRASHREGRHVL